MKQVFVKTPASEEYPAMRMLAESHSSQELVNAVQRVVQSLDLGDSAIFPEPHRHFFQLIRRVGSMEAVAMLNEIPDKGNYQLYSRKQSVLHGLGQVIYDRLDKTVKDSAFPFHNIEAVPVGKEWQVIIRSLRSHSVNGQTVYFSPHKPMLEIDGQKKVVAFTYHAIEQVCNRLVPHWRNYWELADAYSYFADCVYFERTSLHPNKHNRNGLGFSFFNSCALEHFRAEVLNVPCEYALKVIGFSSMMDFKTKGTRWFYRVGYGSCFVLGDYIVAATVLYPGHTTTPEYGLILRSSLTQQQKDAMCQQGYAQTIEDLMRTQDFSLIKWFHDHGIPQVVSFPHDVFAASTEDKATE